MITSFGQLLKKRKSENRERCSTAWSDDDQLFLEVAWACGISINKIAELLGVSRKSTSKRMGPTRVERVRNQIRKDAKKWKNKNKDKLREQQRRHRNRHKSTPEQLIKARVKAKERYWEDAEKSREKGRGAMSKWREQNPEKRREQDRKKEARRRGAVTTKIKITICDIQERVDLFNGKCAYCSKAENITIDHVVPLKAGGPDAISNLVPACRSCNSSKQARKVEEWYKSQPFFNPYKLLLIKLACSSRPETAK